MIGFIVNRPIQPGDVMQSRERMLLDMTPSHDRPDALNGSRNRAALTAKRDAEGEGRLDSPPAPSALITESRLAPQSYGIACAQVTYGGPRGIWLECKGCARSDVIVGSRDAEARYGAITDAEAAEIFRFHGWTGEGERMTNQRCPKCSSS